MSSMNLTLDSPAVSHLTIDEIATVSDYSASYQEKTYETLLKSLIACRGLSDVVVDESGIRVHVYPFSNVPAKLMKQIDRIQIEELCKLSI